ncbi:uncharacterized protein LOC129915769 [Episyrphus balteatus]|uniref:uncharacterized protein LOC129915769 n=1 Tax=Episyrphus balteatus TaxID=286459 RepID=UPI002485AEBE|nr:uncharacterized protein LOC129915769 [Episyrphus balteatus]
MVSLSKLLDQGLRDAKCYEVFHPGRTCVEFQFGHSVYLITKCIKYFLPIVTVPLIIKGRNLRKKHFRNALNYYIELLVTGFLISQSVPIAQCGVRALSGKFTKGSFMFIPMILPTWVVCFTSARVARLFAASMFQVTFEAALRNGKNIIPRTLCKSKLIQGLVFMTCSSFILHAAQTCGIKALWIVKNIPRPTNSESDKCSHDGSCSRFCLKDLARNILIGIAIDLFKTIVLSFTKSKSFLNNLGKKIIKLNFPTTFFLASYSCIYTITSCLLNRLNSTQKFNAQSKHITAAFLGGISYFIMPKLTILCYAITICIEISWKIFHRHSFQKNLKYIELLKKIPFHRIYTCLSAGYLVHTYIFRPESLSPMGLAIVKAFTGDRAPEMKADIYKFFKSIQ